MGQLCERCGMIDSDAGSPLCMYCEKETPLETCYLLKDRIALLERKLNEARKMFAEIRNRTGDTAVVDIADTGIHLIHLAVGAVGGEAAVDRIEIQGGDGRE